VKLRNKIIVLCLTVSIAVVAISGVLIIEGIHNDILDREIEGILENSDNMKMALKRIIGVEGPERSLGILDTIGPENMEVQYMVDYLEAIEGNEVDYGLYYSQDEMIFSTTDMELMPNDPIFSYADNGVKSYELRKNNGLYYVFIGDSIRLRSMDYAVFILRKDITYIMQSRSKEYMNFIGMMAAVAIVLMITLHFFSKRITRNINDLIEVSAKIAGGRFNERVEVSGNDEIAEMAERFNYMAMEVEVRVRELEKASEAQQRFINNLTHEMRTPLTSIIGYAELLRNNLCNAEIQTKGLHHIYEEGKRLETLSRRLVDIVLYENIELSKESVNIGELFDDVHRIVSYKADEKQITLRTVTAEGLLQVDRQLFNVVLSNLIDNAIKASDERSEIEFGAVFTEGQTRLYVRDFGKGISASALQKVKEPFYTSDLARNRNHSGMGLGLTLCDQIVRLHGAQLEIVSEQRIGTTVEISFEPQ